MTASINKNHRLLHKSKLQGSMGGSRVTSSETGVKIWGFELECGLVEMGENWSGSEYILKVKPKGFAVCERY